VIPFSKGNYYLYILDIFSYPIIIKWCTQTHTHKLDLLFLCRQFERNEVISLGPFSYTLRSKSFDIMSIFLIEHDLPLQITLWKCRLEWIFFFKFSNGFKVQEINLYQEKEGMFFIYSYTAPCEFIWQVWLGGGGCVGGRKINPPIPIVLTSLFISNLYMNPIIFNDPFSLLLPPFWF